MWTGDFAEARAVWDLLALVGGLAVGACGDTAAGEEELVLGLMVGASVLFAGFSRFEGATTGDEAPAALVVGFTDGLVTGISAGNLAFASCTVPLAATLDAVDLTGLAAVFLALTGGAALATGFFGAAFTAFGAAGLLEVFGAETTDVGFLGVALAVVLAGLLFGDLVTVDLVAFEALGFFAAGLLDAPLAPLFTAGLTGFFCPAATDFLAVPVAFLGLAAAVACSFDRGLDFGWGA